jgi:glucose-6-phosphate isomerase
MSIHISGSAVAQIDTSSQTYQELVTSLVPLSHKDATLWGEKAQPEAQVRLGWVDLPTNSQQLLPQLKDLQNWATSNGLTHFILCGMGGSSLAPEVLAKTFGKKLTVLDSTNPDQIAAGTPSDLRNVGVIVSSKSGSTIETASQKAYFEALFIAAGLKPHDHFIIVTDPGSPLDQAVRADGLKVINADPNVGGRYSALSAFGLVPAALMGIDVEKLLLDAQAASTSFLESPSTPAQVATLIYEFGTQAVAFSDAGSSLPGISDWIEQLIAESTGKDGKGRLPVVIESPTAPIGGKTLRITFSPNQGDLCVEGPLGAQFIFWEWVTALLSKALGVDPFNQPNVTEAKERTSEILAKGAIELSAPDFENENLAIYGAQSLEEISSALEGEYVAIMAYLNRENDTEVEKLRSLIAYKLNVATTFGWAPRFLHSTGQFHKGGQPNGAFLQITSECDLDLDIPGKTFSFHELNLAQAAGDRAALVSRSYPMVHIHLKNKEQAIAQLLAALS